MELCGACDRPVSGRQHGMVCDTCSRWQHRTCGTGISQAQYRKMMRKELVVHFICCRDHSFQREFERELEEAGDRLVAVDFTATWCTRKNAVSTRLESVEYEAEFSEVLFLQVDVDDNEDTPPFCQIDFLPTIQFYRFGHKVAEIYEDNMDSLRSVLQLHR